MRSREPRTTKRSSGPVERQMIITPVNLTQIAQPYSAIELACQLLFVDLI